MFLKKKTFVDSGEEEPVVGRLEPEEVGSDGTTENREDSEKTQVLEGEAPTSENPTTSEQPQTSNKQTSSARVRPSKKKKKKNSHQYNSYYMSSQDDVYLYHPELSNGLIK